MTNTLLGLGQIIADAIGEVFKAIVTPILKIILNLILTPIINIILTVTKYALGAVGYIISSFLLKLIDFVEILFRALAGLPSKESNVGMGIELSLDGDTGDILIQLIRNHDIQQAFLSMCIVGLFLLVVTTVFQIIKVEYTTEGAKNAKGPIFQKAFKGAANLMLLPLLVVFGIVFANQLLNLLDKATSVQGNNPTISGLLFVAAASDAHYLQHEEQPEDLAKEDAVVDGAVTLIVLSITDAISEALEIVFDGADARKTTLVYKEPDATKRAQIDDKFIAQAGADSESSSGYKYYNIISVTKFYNYSAINYILLLFGSVFVLKALFFTCFGMVIRLYKVAILFIISPAIIGMTPINEGGLGKWRTSFIGQVLSAYGTILSINLFFVVVRVLLNIEVKFTTSIADLSGNTENFLASSFMTLVLKAIFVMAGVLLIEKFSKELGGYFGAEDAMGAGKDMANQVGDLAMKGVGAAAMVASGGASLAMKAGRAAGGIANKVGSGISKAANNNRFAAGRKAGNAAYKDSMKATKGAKWSERRTAAKNAKKEAKDNAKKTFVSEKKASHFVDDMNKYNALESESEDISKQLKALDEKEAKGETLNETEKLSRTALQTRQSKITAKGDKLLTKLDEKGQKKGFTLNTLESVTKRENAKEDAKQKEKLEDKAKKTQIKNQKKLARKATLEGLAETGRKNLPFRKYFDQVDKAQQSGAKILGPQFESAVGAINYAEEKKKQDLAEYGSRKSIDKINAAGATILTLQATRELGTQMSQMTREIVRELQNIAKMKEAGYDSRIIQQRESSLVDSLQKQGSSVTVSDLDGLKSKLEVEGKLDIADLKIEFDPKKLEKAVMAAVSKGASSPDEIRRVIVEELEKVGLAGNANLIKMISDTFEKHIGNLKK